MITEPKEIIKVYTKYDTPGNAVEVPFLKPIDESGSWWFEMEMVYVRLNLKQIENGLEGVRFFHYGS